MNAESKKIMRIAIAGGVAAVVINHFIQPSINKAFKV